MPDSRPHVVVVGSGIAGLSAAWHLRKDCHVTLLEANDRLGGHTHTHEIELHGVRGPVDTGFIVFNHRTYPEIKSWFAELGVLTHAAEMSFSVSRDNSGFEWAGHSLTGLFAQPSNLLSPRFWRMLFDILRFHRQAPALLEKIESGAHAPMSLGQMLEQRGYSQSFQSGYLLPMAGAIWSCPAEQMRAFPFASFTRFCVNHGLLQIANRPQWFSVLGGSQRYIERMLNRVEQEGHRLEVRLGHRVEQLTPMADGSVKIMGTQADGLPFALIAKGAVLAGHTDQSAKVVGFSGLPAAEFLSQFRYQSNTAYLHTDEALMPKRKNAWAAWNYRATPGASTVSVTYWMNQLQSLPFNVPVLVSLNPDTPPLPDKTISRMEYDHPIFDSAAMAARQEILKRQGQGQVWFAGAWMGYGFHEDGFRSGRQAAEGLLQQLRREQVASGKADRLAA